MLTPPAVLHALLFAAQGPLEKKYLETFLEMDSAELALVVGSLEGLLKGSGVSVVESATALELRTSNEAAPIIKKMREQEFSRDLGKASLETLAVIAYQSGSTRSEIDWVRGVNSSASVRTLLMRGLIEGREDERDKRKVRYTLTTEALASLGISGSHELPRSEELSAGARAIVESEAAAVAATEE